MLPKLYRLAPRKAVLRVIRSGRVIHTSGLLGWCEFDRVSNSHPTIKPATNDQVQQCDWSPPQAAIVVSKKVARQATKRNRLKRRLRAITTKQLGNLPAHTRIVVSAKPQALLLDPQQLHAQIKELFSKATCPELVKGSS